MNSSNLEFCNIDQEGVRLRRSSGFILIMLGDIFSILYVIDFLMGLFIIIIFFIYFLGILSLIQAQHQFCVLYALNSYDGIAKAKDNSNMSTKQRKLLKIFIQTLISTSTITILVYLLGITL